MIILRKTIFFLTIVTILFGAGIFATSAIYADDVVYRPIVQKISEKFNLDPKEVQAVFDEERADHFAEMQENYSDRLDQAVADGKITDVQKQLILDKHEEILAKFDEHKDLEPSEREQKMKELHDEVSQWLKDNNIPANFFEGPFMRGFHKGFKMGMRMGM